MTESGTGYHFDRRGDILERELHLGPTEKSLRSTAEYEAHLAERATVYTKRASRLFRALYYTFLSHSEYVAYFLIILNIILNGSILSLLFAVLLYGWGLLSTPWPSKRFWLTLIFYSMLMLVIKYAFQFKGIDYWKSNYVYGDGLYPPRVVGIEYQTNFLYTAMWDMLLLIALLIHRGLLKVRTAYCMYRDCGKEGRDVVEGGGRGRKGMLNVVNYFVFRFCFLCSNMVCGGVVGK